MRLKIIFLIILFFIKNIFCDQLINGYLESRINIRHNPDEKKYTNNYYLKSRIALSGNNEEKSVKYNVTIEGITYNKLQNYELAMLGISEDTGKKSDIKIDRAYIDFKIKNFDIRTGRQRIAIGTSYLFSVLDILNKKKLNEPQYELQGIDAIKFKYNFSDVTNMNIYYLPYLDFDGSISVFHFYSLINNFDVNLIYYFDRLNKREISGLAIKNEKRIGYWCEIEYTDYSDYLSQILVSNKSNFYKVVCGIDYTFSIGTGLYLLSEYLYDGGAEKDKNKYKWTRLVNGEDATLSKNYFYFLERYSFNDFIKEDISTIINLDDKSCMITTQLTYLPITDLQIIIGSNLFFGGNNTEFKPIKIYDPYSLKHTNIYFWIKYNF
ncbi:MAG TPA: hypothetical protein PLD27_05570 [bacterium]|nr:hypothetical protein [bacterium]HOL47836.1 hypothetical protein [bacterium]HPQ19549.1 hypothetical protein [bacterium]